MPMPRPASRPLVAAALAAALALPMAACQGTAPPAAGVQAPAVDAAAQATVEGSGKIRGMVGEDGIDYAVKQAGAKAVGGADVYLDDLPSIRAKTAADGSFELAGVPVGDHFIVAEKATPQGPLKVRAKATLAAPEQIADVKSLVVRRTGSVAGTVTLAGQATGLLGTDVFVAGSTLISKAKDNGAFALVDVAEGVYKVTASRGGYEPTTIEVEVKSGRVASATIDLKKADPSAKVASIAGVVKGAGDKALPGASVSLRGPVTLGTITDEAGNFMIANVPDGAYVLHVFSAGHKIKALSQAVGVVPTDEKTKALDLGAIALEPDAGAAAPAGPSSAGGQAAGGTRAPELPSDPAAPATGGGTPAAGGGTPATGGGTLGPSAEAGSGGPAVPGKLDLEVAWPGGTPRTTNFGQTLVGDKKYDVQYGQGFTPSRDGAVTAVGFSISAGDAAQGKDTTVAVFEAGEDGSPVGARLGGVVLPGANIKRFGLGSLWTPVVFGTPVPVKAGKKYVAVVSTAGDNALLLTNKPAPGGPLVVSFAEIGSEAWLWSEIPDNEGYNFAVFRVYLAE